MCDALTIAGAVLTAGSVAANSIAQSQVQSARDDAINAQNIRQGSLNREADAINEQSRERYEGFEGQRENRSQSLGDFLAEQTAREPSAGTTLAPTSSNITIQEEQKQRDQARQFTDESAENLANFRSFGDLLAGVGRGQARDASEVGQVGSFLRGNAGVLPLELQAANQKGGTARLFGDILGGVGSVGMSAGLGGADLGLDLFGKSVPIPRPRPAGAVSLPSLY